MRFLESVGFAVLGGPSPLWLLLFAVDVEFAITLVAGREAGLSYVETPVTVL